MTPKTYKVVCGVCGGRGSNCPACNNTGEMELVLKSDLDRLREEFNIHTDDANHRMYRMEEFLMRRMNFNPEWD